MQIPYHTKGSLQEYFEATKSGNRQILDFSDKCLLCGEKDCAKYHGHYTRNANCPIENFYEKSLIIFRFICHNKGNKICNHLTFSLLPIQLIPFRKLSLKFKILAVFIRFSKQLSLFKAIEAIETELPNLFNAFADGASFLNVAAQMQWNKLIMDALKLFIANDVIAVTSLQRAIMMKGDKKSLLMFLQIADNYTSCIIPSIRGPDALAYDFFELNGGCKKNAPFLFGIASQHR
jgi:hypothetical protein